MMKLVAVNLLVFVCVALGICQPTWLRPGERSTTNGRPFKDLQILGPSAIHVSIHLSITRSDLQANGLAIDQGLISQTTTWTIAVVAKDAHNNDVRQADMPVSKVSVVPDANHFSGVNLTFDVSLKTFDAKTTYFIGARGEILPGLEPTILVFTAQPITVDPMPFVEAEASVQPARTTLNDNSKAWVLEVPVEVTFKNLVPTQGQFPILGKLQLNLSSRADDAASGWSGAITQSMTMLDRSKLIPYDERDWQVAYQSNLSHSNSKISCHYAFNVPLAKSRLNIGVLRNYAPTHLTLGLISFEHRDKIDLSINPHHVQTTLINPWIKITPATLFPSSRKQPTAEDDTSLSLVATAWYFPSEQAVAGLSVHRFESRLDAELAFPIKNLRVLNAALVLDVGTGANELNDYKRIVTYGVGLRGFWGKTPLAKNPQP